MTDSLHSLQITFEIAENQHQYTFRLSVKYSFKIQKGELDNIDYGFIKGQDSTKTTFKYKQELF